jgi:hypothetical protein
MEKKKNNGINWILWWQVDQEELKRQVAEYKKLGITKSARGVAALCLLVSVIITTILIVANFLGAEAFLDVFLLSVLAFFMYKGHKWAMIGAMILWTLEKLYMLLVTGSNNPVIAFFWWSAYMHAFWTAFKVEQAREKKT